jgi:hypothetical protein
VLRGRLRRRDVSAENVSLLGNGFNQLAAERDGSVALNGIADQRLNLSAPEPHRRRAAG